MSKRARYLVWPTKAGCLPFIIASVESYVQEVTCRWLTPVYVLRSPTNISPDLQDMNYFISSWINRNPGVFIPKENVFGAL